MDIVEEIRKDRENGAKRLVSEYKNGLLTLARRFCSDMSDAEELVNRTFAEVLANVDRYAEQSAFFGWMCQILSNLHANDCRRKSNANTVYPGDVPDVADWSAQEAIFSGLDHESLRDAIEQLPKGIRKAVILHYFEEMPVREVARILSTPTGTIAWRLHCAREILAAKLGAGAKKAVSKSGAKALLIALALVAVAAVGAVGVVAIRSAAEPEAEESEVVFNAKSTENTEGSLEVFEGLSEECLSSGADPTNHETNGDSPQQSEAIIDNSNTNTEESAMNTKLVKSAAVKALALGAMLMSTPVQAADYYVAKTGSDDGDGSEDHPFATISNAIEKAAAEIDANGGSAAVHIASGTYEETGFVLDRPIVVIGDDRDTVNIYDAVQKSRAFTISHDNAAVMNLTISGTGYNYYNNTGGHVQMSAGTVENCIIREGRINQSDTVYSGGGNVHISGGRLVRCQVLGGVLAANAWNLKVSYGAGVYASGGIVDSCLIKGNQSYNNGRCGGIYVSGDATVVNCTVTGNLPPPKGSGDTVTAGIHIGSAEATVANCVFYGNGDGSAAANFGTANLNRFFNCASSADNPSCATWKVLTDDDFAEYAAGNLRPRAGSQLIDNGSKSRRPADGATLDLDGENRVSGESVDIGAWEYDQSQLSCGGHLSSYSALEQSNVVFYATAIGTASNPVFRWDYGNGTVEETQESAHVYAYPASGLFTVRLSASPDGGASWCEWYTVPTRMVVAPETMYVDSNCATPAFPYKTRDTAAATLGAAYGALTNNVSEGATCVDGAEIVILKGSRLTETDMHLESAVTIRGDTDDPSDVEIVDAVQKSRAFAIVHPQARVANLTISGAGYYWASSTGGHVQMSAGTVENCIIRDGRINQSGSADTKSGGGNVHISGGRLLRCQVLGGVLAANAWNQNVSYGAGIYATGGIVDSCLIKGNQSYNNGRCGGIYVSGDAKVVNCTVTGNLPPPSGSGDTVTAGIHIGSAEATVANCVFYGNGDGSAKANFGNANLDRFFYCGSSVTNESCATWTVLTDADFVDYAGGNLHQKRDSQLVDHGTTDTTYRPADCSTLDLDGSPRIQGRIIDIGCYEASTGIGSVYYIR